MSKPVLKGLKITFLVHFIISGIVGIQHYFAPRIWTDLAGMEISETVTWRVIGAALIGFAASSWFAWRSANWGKVRIIVIMQIIWSFLGALVIIWGILFEGLASLEWLNALILLCFAVLFSYFMIKRK